MRIVITGGLGFIGQNLARKLRWDFAELELVAIDWLADPSPEEHEAYDRVIDRCFADASVLSVYTSADIVIHLAGQTTVQGSISDPMGSFDNNLSKTHKMLDHIRRTSPGTKVIFASTGGALAGDVDRPVCEDMVPNPMSPYGASKLAIEGLLCAYKGSYGLSSAILRFSNVYGPYAGRKDSVISLYCKQYLRNEHLVLNGDGKQTRDYIHADDIGEAVSQVIRRNAEGIFQLGTGTATSLIDLLRIFYELDPSKKFGVLQRPALTGEVRHNVADISKARRVLGFEPRFSVASGVCDTMEWFRGELARTAPPVLRQTSGTAELAHLLKHGN